MKENLSESESDWLLAKTASDLNYACKIDAVSEAEIVDAVRGINYSIDTLINNILASVKGLKLSYSKRSSRKNRSLRDIPSNPDLDIPLLQSLLTDPPSLLSDDSRDFVVETILHNLICSLIHERFFKGGHFFGVGSDAHHEYLETMFSKLVAGSKF